MSKKDFSGGLDKMLNKTVTEPETKEKSVKEDESINVRTTLLLNSKTYELIKSIAYWERKSIKEIIEEGLTLIINKYPEKEINNMIDVYVKSK